MSGGIRSSDGPETGTGKTQLNKKSWTKLTLLSILVLGPKREFWVDTFGLGGGKSGDIPSSNVDEYDPEDYEDEDEEIDDLDYSIT